MKRIHQTLIYGAALIAVATLGVGCGTLLTQNPSAAAVPVISGAATTNDCNAIAYEKLALELNAEYNQTSTQPLVAAGIGALLTLTSAFSGWYSRHHTAQAQISAALLTPPPTQKTG